MGVVLHHHQCFSGHDDLKTDEDYPILAYRAFYRVDKLKFARYNKGRNMPHWLLPMPVNVERDEIDLYKTISVAEEENENAT